MAVKDYNVDPDLNTTIEGINIAEGCPPSGINNAIRQLMADVKAEQDVRGEEWAFQSAKDAAQDEAISAAQSSADAAQSSADAAQSSADAAQSSADAAQSSADAAQSSISLEKQLLKDQIQKAVPVGTVIAFAANTSSAPAGFLHCGGGAVSRSTYAALFATIGTTYGAGDGSTTFNLPDLTDRFIQGSGSAGTKKEAGLPNITGSIGSGDDYGPTRSAIKSLGALYTASYKRGLEGDSYSNGYDILLDASRSSSIYGKSNTVQPPALTMRYYIKY